VKLTTHLPLVPRSRIRGAVRPLSQYASMVWCSVKAPGQLYLYLYHRVQNGSGAHPAPYPMGTGGLFPWRVKRSGCEAGHSPPSNAEVKKAWICTSPPQYAFMARCSVEAQGHLYPNGVKNVNSLLCNFCVSSLCTSRNMEASYFNIAMNATHCTSECSACLPNLPG
jgi:hypothetical protein